MNPGPSVHYWWNCELLKRVCEIIIANKDCTDEIKKICEVDIENALVKIHEGLYNHPLIFEIKKDDVFCREVVAHYLLKENPDLKDIIESEVDKWIDYYSSVEFQKSIKENDFTISHCKINLSEMLRDYFYDKHKIKVDNKKLNNIDKVLPVVDKMKKVCEIYARNIFFDF